MDLDRGTLTVRRQLQWLAVDGKQKPVFTEPKSAKSRRTIALPSAAVAALRSHRVRQAEERLRAGKVWQDHGLVFTTVIGTPIGKSNLIRRSFRALLDKAGLPRIRFHDLRHTAATLLLQQGVHPKLAQELLGHSRINVTLDIYSHVTAPMMQEAARKMDEVLAAAKAKRR